jgi:hypothetical protein
MVWGVIRILIIGTAFCVGLLIGSGHSSANAAKNLAQIERQVQVIEANCRGKNIVLVSGPSGGLVAMR